MGFGTATGFVLPLSCFPCLMPVHVVLSSGFAEWYQERRITSETDCAGLRKRHGGLYGLSALMRRVRRKADVRFFKE